MSVVRQRPFASSGKKVELGGGISSDLDDDLGSIGEFRLNVGSNLAAEVEGNIGVESVEDEALFLLDQIGRDEGHGG